MSTSGLAGREFPFKTWFLTTNKVDLLLGALLTVDGIAVPGFEFPFSTLVVGVLVLRGLLRAPRYPLGRYGALAWVVVFLLFYIASVSFLSLQGSYAFSWVKRWARIVGIVVLAYLLATERVNLRSLLHGIMIGLLLNVPAFLAGLTPRDYGHALTGWVGDKNKAGMYYATLGIIVLWQLRHRWMRVLMSVVFAIPVWLTDSRTSLFAYAMGLAWVWLVARRPPAIRWGFAVAALYLFQFLEANFAQIGIYADRVGSDQLRERIGTAVAEKLATTPFQGLGLGEAYVVIDGYVWLFHDSVATLRVEGGWLWMISIVGLTLLVGFRPFGAAGSSYQGMVTQSATVVLFLCALKLGEVYLTIPWAIVFGVCLNYLLRGAPASSHIDSSQPLETTS